AAGLSISSSYTPLGSYSISSNGTAAKYSLKPMGEPDGSTVYARWASHVVGNVYFHAIAVGSQSHYALRASNYNKLGSAASAGCIRMTVADAKWLYDYAAVGSSVKIEKGNSKKPGPLGKAATIKIAESINYDPTDPSVPAATKKKDYKAGRISGYMTSKGKKVGY
ncbi:L,D-transpeptidase, partial [Butyribacter intestini]